MYNNAVIEPWIDLYKSTAVLTLTCPTDLFTNLFIAVTFSTGVKQRLNNECNILM